MRRAAGPSRHPRPRLDEGSTLNKRFFLDLLNRGFSEEETHAQLAASIDRGRYGELFDFDVHPGELRLDQRGREIVATEESAAFQGV